MVQLNGDFTFPSPAAWLSTSALGATRYPVMSVSSMRIDCRGDDGFRPDRPGRGSVTIYEHQNFRGDSETFAAGRIAFMSDTRVGNDRASSVRIEGPCQITLFEHQEFRGRSSTFNRDVADLSGTEVGNDAASSFIIECR